MAVRNTNKIPANTFRSSIRFRPGKRCRLGTFGISGSTSSHNASDTSGLGIWPHPPSRYGRSPLRHRPTGPFSTKKATRPT
jgi:hypothetical protein